MRTFWLILVISFSNIAIALFQYFACDFIFYANALDESNYLQYHHSLLATKLMVRPVQNAVNFLHEHGFSGGHLNFIFDLIFPTLVILLATRAFKMARLFKGYEIWAAAAFIALPLAFNTFNPGIKILNQANLAGGGIYWFTMPDAWFPPVLRSPEPQFSFAVLGIAALLSLRFSNVWPLIACIPFLYTFVALPLAFICGFLLSRSLRVIRNLPVWASAVAAFVGLAVLLRLYFDFVVREEAKGNIVATHLPLISYCGIFTMLLYLLVHKYFSGRAKEVLLAISMAPWATANTQIISGFITAPSNFEQYFGVCAVSLMLLIFVDRYFQRKQIFCALAVSLLLLFNAGIFKEHFQYMRMLPPTSELIGALKKDPYSVAINHIKLASLYNQIYPMQVATFFSYSRMYWGEARSYLPDYLCAKQQINAAPLLREKYANTLGRMDAALTYETENDLLITLGRRENGPVKLDVDAAGQNCDRLKLNYFYIHGTEPPAKLKPKVDFPGLQESPALEVATLR